MERLAFVLDTNVLLHDPNAIYAFEGDVVIPMAVIEEIDKIKKERSDRGRAARTISRLLCGHQEKTPLSKGSPLPNGRKLFVIIDDLEGASPDKRIISVAANYKFIGRGKAQSKTILVSNDLNVRIQGDASGVEVQGYDNKLEADSSEIYSGISDLEIPADDIESFFQDGGVELEFDQAEPAPNEFLLLTSGTSSALAQWNAGAGAALKLEHADRKAYGLHGRNKEQKFALEALFDRSVEIVTMVGVAGTGKTLLAIAAGLQQVEDGNYDKVVVTRPVVEMGKGIGYLPGDMKEKLGPLMQPIADNVEFLVNGDKQKKSKPRRDGQAQQQRTAMDDLEMFGQLEVAALPWIRGRTMPRQFIIVDEAQNLTHHEVKTIISRAGEGSKVVLTGDPDQIDCKEVDALTNGLSIVVDAFRGEENAAHVTLTKGERSRLAEQAARLL